MEQLHCYIPRFTIEKKVDIYFKGYLGGCHGFNISLTVNWQKLQYLHEKIKFLAIMVMKWLKYSAR